MVLDFGMTLGGGLFPQSDATGEGMTSGVEEQIVWQDVGAGLRWVTILDPTLYSQPVGAEAKTLFATWNINLKDLDYNIVVGYRVQMNVNSTWGGGQVNKIYYELVSSLGLIKSKFIGPGLVTNTIYYCNWFFIDEDTFTTTDGKNKNFASLQVKLYLETGLNVGCSVSVDSMILQVLISDRLGSGE